MVSVAIREPTFKFDGSKPDGSEGGFYGIGGPYMRPMLGWKVIEGKQDFFIFLQTFEAFGNLIW